MTLFQLPLGLALRDSARFESYYPGENREAVLSLQQAAAGTGERLVYVASRPGLGKTHLLQAACHHAMEQRRSTAYLPVRELPDLTPAVFEGLEQLDTVCIDDVDALAGDREGETGLFACFNRVRDAGGVLLLAAGQRPDRAGFRLSDLESRLGWGVTYVLKPLDEDALLSALTRRAHGRGLELPEDTARFLLRRFPRDLPSLCELLDRLDRASLAAQRRLTIPFVKSVLSSTGGGPESF